MPGANDQLRGSMTDFMKVYVRKQKYYASIINNRQNKKPRVLLPRGFQLIKSLVLLLTFLTYRLSFYLNRILF